jgi:hypothetical protein
MARPPIVGCALVAAAAMVACDKDAFTAAPPAAFPTLHDVTAASGIDFVHQRGATPTRYLVETMGGGVAVLDYDGDGRQDLYFVDSGEVPVAPGARAGSNKLYRNLGGLRFEDVTERARAAGRGYMMGAIAGDIDNDGDQDLFVTGVGATLLLRNRGDGAFEERTAEAGLEDVGWSTAAAFFDLDLDGDLDLFMARYVRWDFAEQRAHTQSGVPVHPAPDLFDPIDSRLWRNRGDGTFEDVSSASGVAGLLGKGLGVIASDLDLDGDVDVFVANDTERNFVLENRGDGTLRDVGVVSGAAYGAEGRAQSGMGADAADWSGDGRFDVVVTNFQRETNSMFRNEGGLRFTEVSAATGTAEAAMQRLGFGVRFADLDCDGRVDLVVANGHIHDRVAEIEPGVAWAQPPLLFRGLGSARFESELDLQPTEFRRARVGRGLAGADLDDDGDVDLVMGVLGGAAAVFENRGGNARAWLTVLCRGTLRDSTALGARVEVETGGQRWVQEVRSGGSYLSQSDLRLHFGLGEARVADVVRVRWPGGAVEEARDVPLRRQVTFVEGRGLAR